VSAEDASERGLGEVVTRKDRRVSKGDTLERGLVEAAGWEEEPSLSEDESSKCGSVEAADWKVLRSMSTVNRSKKKTLWDDGSRYPGVLLS
jgi:hypothetical protein